MTPMKTHLTIRVEGIVQGVGFRWAVRTKAVQLGISGSVRNEDDGSVLIEAEADPAVMDTFLEWCRRGPVSAQVDQVLVEPGRLRGYSVFEILF